MHCHHQTYIHRHPNSNTTGNPTNGVRVCLDGHFPCAYTVNSRLNECVISNVRVCLDGHFPGAHTVNSRLNECVISNVVPTHLVDSVKSDALYLLQESSSWTTFMSQLVVMTMIRCQTINVFNKNILFLYLYIYIYIYSLNATRKNITRTTYGNGISTEAMRPKMSLIS